jgi:hypothetical protein
MTVQESLLTLEDEITGRTPDEACRTAHQWLNATQGMHSDPFFIRMQKVVVEYVKLREQETKN